MISWIFIELAQLRNCPWVDMSHHLDTSSWFRVNQCLFLLL